MPLSLSLPLPLPLRGVGYTRLVALEILSRSASQLPRLVEKSSSSGAGAVKFAPPRALYPSEVVDCPALLAEKLSPPPSPSPFAARHIDCWNLWQLDGLTIREIAERQNIKEETIFHHLIVCVRNGCRIDWFEMCREAKLTSDVAEMLEVAFLRARYHPHMSLKRFCPRESVTYEQCALFREMKSKGIRYQDIQYVASALDCGESDEENLENVERIKDVVITTDSPSYVEQFELTPSDRQRAIGRAIGMAGVGCEECFMPFSKYIWLLRYPPSCTA